MSFFAKFKNIINYVFGSKFNEKEIRAHKKLCDRFMNTYNLQAEDIKDIKPLLMNISEKEAHQIIRKQMHKLVKFKKKIPALSINNKRDYKKYIKRELKKVYDLSDDRSKRIKKILKNKKPFVPEFKNDVQYVVLPQWWDMSNPTYIKLAKELPLDEILKDVTNIDLGQVPESKEKEWFSAKNVKKINNYYDKHPKVRPVCKESRLNSIPCSLCVEKEVNKKIIEIEETKDEAYIKNLEEKYKKLLKLDDTQFKEKYSKVSQQIKNNKDNTTLFEVEEKSKGKRPHLKKNGFEYPHIIHVFRPDIVYHPRIFYPLNLARVTFHKRHPRYKKGYTIHDELEAEEAYKKLMNKRYKDEVEMVENIIKNPEFFEDVIPSYTCTLVLNVDSKNNAKLYKKCLEFKNKKNEFLKKHNLCEDGGSIQVKRDDTLDKDILQLYKEIKKQNEENKGIDESDFPEEYYTDEPEPELVEEGGIIKKEEIEEKFERPTVKKMNEVVEHKEESEEAIPDSSEEAIPDSTENNVKEESEEAIPDSTEEIKKEDKKEDKPEFNMFGKTEVADAPKLNMFGQDKKNEKPAFNMFGQEKKDEINQDKKEVAPAFNMFAKTEAKVEDKPKDNIFGQPKKDDAPKFDMFGQTKKEDVIQDKKDVTPKLNIFGQENKVDAPPAFNMFGQTKKEEMKEDKKEAAPAFNMFDKSKKPDTPKFDMFGQPKKEDVNQDKKEAGSAFNMFDQSKKPDVPKFDMFGQPKKEEALKLDMFGQPKKDNVNVFGIAPTLNIFDQTKKNDVNMSVQDTTPQPTFFNQDKKDAMSVITEDKSKMSIINNEDSKKEDDFKPIRSIDDVPEQHKKFYRLYEKVIQNSDKEPEMTEDERSLLGLNRVEKDEDQGNTWNDWLPESDPRKYLKRPTTAVIEIKKDSDVPEPPYERPDYSHIVRKPGAKARLPDKYRIKKPPVEVKEPDPDAQPVRGEGVLQYKNFDQFYNVPDDYFTGREKREPPENPLRAKNPLDFLKTTGIAMFDNLKEINEKNRNPPKYEIVDNGPIFENPEHQRIYNATSPKDVLLDPNDKMKEAKLASFGINVNGGPVLRRSTDVNSMTNMSNNLNMFNHNLPGMSNPPNVYKKQSNVMDNPDYIHNPMAGLNNLNNVMGLNNGMMTNNNMMSNPMTNNAMTNMTNNAITNMTNMTNNNMVNMTSSIMPPPPNTFFNNPLQGTNQNPVTLRSPTKRSNITTPYIPNIPENIDTTSLISDPSAFANLFKNKSGGMFDSILQDTSNTGEEYESTVKYRTNEDEDNNNGNFNFFT